MQGSSDILVALATSVTCRCAVPHQCPNHAKVQAFDGVVQRIYALRVADVWVSATSQKIENFHGATVASARAERRPFYSTVDLFGLSGDSTWRSCESHVDKVGSQPPLL